MRPGVHPARLCLRECGQCGEDGMPLPMLRDGISKALCRVTTQRLGLGG